MKFGVCTLNHIPLRKDPSDKSEMINQLLFGDVYEVLDETPKWISIKLSHDQYQGWICAKQYSTLSKTDYDNVVSSNQAIAKELVGVIGLDNGYMPIVLGSSMLNLNSTNGQAGSLSFSFEGEVIQSPIPNKLQIIEDAFMFLGAPYLWGGRSPFGIDCSGFTQIVYKLNGINLPRDAYQQATLGESYSFVEEAEPGDLAFFDNEEGRIIHVGILIGDNKIIHASGKVRIDKLDHQGIFNTETNSYSHKLRIIKKIF